MSNIIWFKNAQVYVTAGNFLIDEAIIEKIEVMAPFSDCQPQQSVSIGFVPVIPGTEELCYQNENSYLFCVQIQKRILPGYVVNDELNKKVNQLQKSEERRIGTKERRNLKDEIIFSLMPKTFKKNTRHYFYFDNDKNLLVVDAAGATLADDVTSFVRECIGSLPMTILQSHVRPGPVMTNWLINQDQPKGWEILGSAEFINPSDSDKKVIVKNVELTPDNLVNDLLNGDQVSKLSVEYHEQISFYLTDKAEIKSIKYADLLTEQALDGDSDDLQAQFAASFILMSNTLTGLITEMIEIFPLPKSD